jgi:hypothetical protein
MSGSVVISGQLTGVPVGTIQVGPLTIAAQTSNEVYIATYTFSSGNNIQSIPACVGALIEPNPSNTVSLTLKGNVADTGIPISPTLPTLLTFPASWANSLVFVAGAAFTTTTSVTYF